jgi:hypothetical protein
MDHAYTLIWRTTRRRTDAGDRFVPRFEVWNGRGHRVASGHGAAEPSQEIALASARTLALAAGERWARSRRHPFVFGRGSRTDW